MMLPNIEPFVSETTEARPGSKPGLLQTTCMSSFERLIMLEPGVVMYHLPLLLESSHKAPGTSLPACSSVWMETLWFVVPVTDAQPLARPSTADAIARLPNC